MSEQPTQKRKKIDWSDVLQSVVKAVAIGLVLGAGTLAWNNFSNERVLKLLGGVSQSELEVTIKRLTLAGPPGPAGRPGEILFEAVVAFDGPCPPGWKYYDAVVGSAIVGSGATRVGETGEPLGTKGTYSDYPTPNANTKRKGPPGEDVGWGRVPSRSPDFIPDLGYDFQTISRYVPGVKTAITPTYLPLMYCKREGRP
jgi:hypothetical protein